MKTSFTLLLALVVFGAHSNAYANSRKVLAEINKRIKAEDSLQKHEVELLYHQGHITIKGHVSSEADSQQIKQMAQETKGVKGVTSLLEIVPETSRSNYTPNMAADAVPSNQELERRVVLALKKVSNFDPHGITVRANNGLVSLSGSRKSFREIDRVLSIVLMTEGVTDIKSDMTIDGKPYASMNHLWKIE